LDLLPSKENYLIKFSQMLEKRSLWSGYTHLGMRDPREKLFPREFKESLQGIRRPSLESTRLSIFGQQIQTPLGLSALEFQRFIAEFQGGAATQSLAGLIVTGSRTHFSYGTIP
jgi:hypothetical protein